MTETLERRLAPENPEAALVHQEYVHRAGEISAQFKLSSALGLDSGADNSTLLYSLAARLIKYDIYRLQEHRRIPISWKALARLKLDGNKDEIKRLEEGQKVTDTIFEGQIGKFYDGVADRVRDIDRAVNDLIYRSTDQSQRQMRVSITSEGVTEWAARWRAQFV